MKVLIIEDDEEKGAAIEAALKEQEHEVTWAIGAKESADVLKILLPPVKSLKFAEVKLADFKVAFVDMALPMEHSLQGDKLVPLLVSNGICCIATSSDYHCNKALLEAGATFFETKKFVAERLKEEPDLLDRALKRAAEKRKK